MYNQFPYFGMNPSIYNQMPTTSGNIGGLLGISKKTINWDTFLNNAQRTLNVINQAMPIYNQVKPMFRNMGTIFRVIGELNNTAPAVTSIASSTATTAAKATIASGAPQFFV